jgi:hypothetical protein
MGQVKWTWHPGPHGHGQGVDTATKSDAFGITSLDYGLDTRVRAGKRGQRKQPMAQMGEACGEADERSCGLDWTRGLLESGLQCKHSSPATGAAKPIPHSHHPL